MSRLLKDTSVTFLAEGFGAVALMVNGVLIARATGAGGKGTFTLISSFAAFGATFLGIRWERSTGHFLAQREERLAPILGSILVVTAWIALLGQAAWQIFPSLFGRVVFRGIDSTLISLAFVMVCVQFFSTSIAAVYGGMRRFFTRSVFLTLAAATLMGSSAVLFAIGTTNIATYVAGYLVCWAALCVVWLPALLWRRRIRPAFDVQLVREMASYGSLSYVSLLLDFVTLRLDVFLLNYLTLPAEVGVYSVALGIAAQLARIPNILGHVVFNRTSAGELGSGETTARIMRLAFLAMMGAGTLLAVIGSVAIGPLYGDAFVPALRPLMILIPATACWGLYRLLAADIEGRGRPGLISVCSLVASLTIVVLDVWWIPAYGMIGAAWASLVAYAVACAGAAYCFCRITGMTLSAAYAPKSADLGALARAIGRFA